MTKMKITHHRVIGDGCILAESFSVLSSFKYAVSDSVFKRESLMEK